MIKHIFIQIVDEWQIQIKINFIFVVIKKNIKMRTLLLLALLSIILFPNKLLAQYEIMLSNNYPPFNFVDEKGELTGFNVEILESILDLYNSDIKITSGDWETINNALENDKIDAIAGIHYPEVPDNEFIYTRSIINTSHCFIYNPNKVKRFSLEIFRSLNKPTIALYKNDLLMRYMWSINPTTKFLFFDNYKDLIESLDNEDVYCVFAKRVGGIYFAEKYGHNNFEASDHRILERSMGLKVSKKHPELAKIINIGMEVILENGTYEKIYSKWIPKYDQPYMKWQKYLKVVSIIGFVILLMALVLTVFNRILRNRVVLKTNDLRKQLKVNSLVMKELEEQKNLAEESDKMKSSFLANMSHEIRTPMNGIIGFAELIKSEDLSKKEQEQFLDVILRSGNRMLNTINNIIEVAKLDSGVEKLQIQKTDVIDILNELEDFFGSEADNKGLDLIFEKYLITTNDFYTDEYKLNSIFTNLIKNAIKFTENGYVKVKLKLSDKELVFTVEDSGVGIPEEKQQSVFDQFVQADFSHSNGFEGSGLGLAITMGYIQLLEGDIQLTSKPNEGTKFIVQIPNKQ